MLCTTKTFVYIYKELQHSTNPTNKLKKCIYSCVCVFVCFFSSSFCWTENENVLVMFACDPFGPEKTRIHRFFSLHFKQRAKEKEKKSSTFLVLFIYSHFFISICVTFCYLPRKKMPTMNVNSADCECCSNSRVESITILWIIY